MRSTPTPRSTSTGISLRPICVTVGGLCGSQLHTAHSGLSSLRALSLFSCFAIVVAHQSQITQMGIVRQV